MIGIGRTIGWFFSHARDAIARRLVRLGVTPNTLTIIGTLLAIPLGMCYALAVKTGQPMFYAFALVIIYWESAADMLDGAVARIGGKSSEFGAFLDSTCDRISDFCIWGGLAFGFLWRSPANLTFALLCMLAFLWAFLISYTRARAAILGVDCKGGYWQRPERLAGVLFATIGCNPGAMVTELSILPFFTFLHRVLFTRAALAGKNPVTDYRHGKWYHRIQPWAYPRMSWPYDLWTIALVAYLIWAPVDPDQWDVLRWWLK